MALILLYKTNNPDQCCTLDKNLDTCIFFDNYAPENSYRSFVLYIGGLIKQCVPNYVRTKG